MRVTQSMLSNNMLRNLNTSYSKMSKIQQQIESGKKINRPSDDPVTAVKGMAYRTDIDKINQYQRNMGEANSWLDTTDESLGQVGEALKRVKELVVQAANDTNTSEDRQKINSEIEQIKQQLRDIANTKVGDKYIFSGTHTGKPLYTDPTAPGQNPDVSIPGAENEFKIDVFDGISIKVNTQGSKLFNDIDEFMGEVSELLNSGATGAEISEALGADLTTVNGTFPGLDTVYENVLTARADVGARQNRIEMMGNRLDIQFVNVSKQMSENEDTDYAAAITEMVTQESIHQAALSVGAKIIQQTLVDFIR
ncbi:flagellar hook-associated protein FlgL [Solibacillus sp. CAU 1738]|uniref:flagellar hook-associated protein FlgL n=1 Tax=Solibacillus sp. CAU 1738 TaxID=3140363 RepID=UPI0032603617